MTTKYTPGPWEAEFSPSFKQFRITDVTGDVCATVSAYAANPDADARLIAAAPELVEALRDAANRIDDMLEGNDGQAWGEARQSAARFRALLARIDE